MHVEPKFSLYTRPFTLFRVSPRDSVCIRYSLFFKPTSVSPALLHHTTFCVSKWGKWQYGFRMPRSFIVILCSHKMALHVASTASHFVYMYKYMIYYIYTVYLVLAFAVSAIPYMHQICDYIVPVKPSHAILMVIGDAAVFLV